MRNYSFVVAGNLMRWVGELCVIGMLFSVAGLAVARGRVANDKLASLPLGAKLHTTCPLKVNEMPYPVKNVCSFSVYQVWSIKWSSPPNVKAHPATRNHKGKKV